MSCYEWEEGTLLLPTKEAVRVREAMKSTAERHRKRLYDAAQEFWGQLPSGYRRSREKYAVAVQAFLYGNHAPRGQHDWSPPGVPDPKLPAWPGVKQDGEFGFWDDLNELLSRVTNRWEVTTVTPNYERAKPYEQRNWVPCPPHRVRQSDVVQLFGKITGATFTIQCGEPSIHFDKRKVTWTVPENNHACDRGREHPMAREFFRLLGTVTWTRGTGGDIVGNNEYARDSREEGGGGNYLVSSYGPERKSARSRRLAGARR